MNDDTGGTDVATTGAEAGSDADTRPATMVVTWDVVPGRETEFETWAHDLNETATRFPGHLGATWLRAEGTRHRYYTVLNFTDEDRLRKWLRSSEREELVRRLDGIAREHRQGDTSGLETWFSLPGESVPPPPRWKMVLVTLVAVYPINLLFQGVLAPLTQSAPVWLRGLMFPVIMVPTLTYVIMPRLSRLLRGWLYPSRRSHPPARRTRPYRDEPRSRRRKV
jgi:antibiotic biosynthesis monooxygenase (ABM) superfamily enzyme